MSRAKAKAAMEAKRRAKQAKLNETKRRNDELLL